MVRILLRKAVSADFHNYFIGIIAQSFPAVHRIPEKLWDFPGKFSLPVAEGAKAKPVAEDDRSVRERLSDYINSGMDKKEAIKLVAKEMGLPKNAVYMEAVDL